MHECALFYVWDASLGDGDEYLPDSYDSAGVLLPQLLEVEVSAHSENLLKFATELQQLAHKGDLSFELSLAFGATVAHVQLQDTFAVSLPLPDSNMQEAARVIAPLAKKHGLVFYYLLGLVSLPDGQVFTSI